MTENYYTSLLKHIESLISSGDYKNAKKLVDEELSMPFVPKDTLEKLLEYNDYIQGQLSEEKGTKIMSKQEVYESLKKQNEMAYKALETLAMSNIRNYLDVIRDLLEDESINHILKALLIEQLSMQQVSEIVQIVENGKILNVIPSALPLAITQKNYAVIESKLEKLILTNPTFLTQCKMVLANVAYDRYPAMIADEDIFKVTYSIIRYVYLAYGDDIGLQSFLREHDIEENDLEEYGF